MQSMSVYRWLAEMRDATSRRWKVAQRLTAIAMTAGAWTAPLAQQQTGTISGRVTDAQTKVPVVAARVVVTGTATRTLTGDDGRFTLRAVPAGSVELTVTRIGFEAKRIPVSVTVGSTTTADVELPPATTLLAQVVTTVTGDQRKVELGNSIATIKVADKIAEAPIKDLSGLLSGRAAGVQVVEGGVTGAGSRIRIRGQSSLSLSNEPIVIVDGVRVLANSGSSAIGVGGSSPSRLNDINPEDIENIEIIKGPSAATLYGTDAANGVINITTKKGKAGRTSWDFYTENGVLFDPNHYPELWYLYGTSIPGGVSGRCVLTQVAAGTCRADSLITNNVLNNEETTVLSRGFRQQYGVQLNGGTDRTQYFLSGEWEDQLGHYKMPDFEVERLKTERAVSSLPEEQVRPNALNRVSLRANLSTQLSPLSDLQLSTGYVTSNQRLPQNEDNSNGLMVAALGGLAPTNTTDGRGVPLRGYRSFPIGDVLSRTTTQDLDRFINSLASRWRPKDWLSTRATVGLDFASRVDQSFNAFDQGPLSSATARSGQISNQRTEIAQYSVDLGVSATHTPWSGIGAKTSVGAQYGRSYFSRTGGTGETLPPGGTTVNSAAVRNTSQATDETITLGYYIEEALSFNERLFVTGAVRMDDNSAFGAAFNAVIYPKFSVSWLASNEGFFPDWNWLSSMRLRGTYGASGQQPGTTDALRFFSPVGTTLSGAQEVPGVTLGALGNRDLRPEYTAEVEGGIDATLWSNRANIELTYYRKNTRDALIERRVAPSLAGVTSRFENIGSVRNQGFELVVNGQLFDRSWASLDLSVTGSTNKNRLITLGEGVSPINTGNRNTQLNTPGYPLYGLWGRLVNFDDANGDGILVSSEVTYGANTFIGPTYPTRELAVSPAITLLNSKLRIHAQLDYKGGFRKLNNTLRHQCQGGQSCRGLYDKTAPLVMQAAAIAANANVFTSYYERGDFTRFREASVSYDMPIGWAHRVGANRMSLSVTARNLAVWSKYSGVDPEATVGNSDTRGNEEFFSTPPLRTFTVRFNISY